MDLNKKIQSLLSENEFLHLQLVDLNETIARRQSEIDFINHEGLSAAALEAKIASNTIELEVLQNMLDEVLLEASVAQAKNEHLEGELLQQSKLQQNVTEAQNQLQSAQVNLQIVTDELDATASFYKQIVALKAKLTEANSTIAILTEEKNYLKDELNETMELLKLYQKKH